MGFVLFLNILPNFNNLINKYLPVLFSSSIQYSLNDIIPVLIFNKIIKRDWLMCSSVAMIISIDSCMHHFSHYLFFLFGLSKLQTLFYHV